MAKWLHMSKAFAVAAIIMTISAIAGIIAMVITYQIQIDKLGPTPRPTYAPTTVPPSDRPPNMRLPGNLVPTHYKLTLKPHLYTRINTTNDNSPNQTMSFTGNSTVDFHCIQKTTSIFLHSQNLTLMKVKVTDRDTDRSLPYSDIIEYKDGSDFLEIQMSNLLAEGGNYSLFVEFLGEMLEDMSGLYVSTYHEGVQDTGEDTKRYLATSQLQPTDARKVFPCFDEPALKATFEVTIIHRRGTTALGNWELLESNIVDDWLYTRFYPTRKMSTYLLAFAVSEFSSISSVHGRVKVTTHARQEAINAGHLDYANKVTGQFLTFFEDHLGIIYPLQKLDQVAVPDILASGMENWGLIMYLETSLLHDKQISPIINKEWIAEVIAHELAHQWFGNLVTMKWWNDIWLNEGFAMYLADLAVDHVERDWNIKNKWVMDQLHIAFQVDCLASSHPLSSPADDIQTTDQIHELFSSITYCKGAAVLRMLEDVLTAKVFHAGIKMYLSAFQYNNTETKDLWNYLQKAVYEYGGNIKVAEVMNTWTNQIGFPVITINTTDGEVYQRRFTLNQSAEYSQVWHIPIRVMSKTSEPSIVFLDTDKPVKKDEFIAKPGDWVLANINSTGFYRVNYNPENWESLLNELEGNLSRIPVLNRAQLIDDAFNLARVKLVTVTLALDSTRFLQNEKAYIPWESAIRNLHYFAAMFDRTDVYGPMQVYMQKLVRPLYLFYNNYTDSSSVPTDHSHQHNQVNAIKIACTSGLPECQDMATRMFKTWMKNETNNSIHPNLRSAIYCQAIAAGGQREWDFAWRMYHNQTVRTETMLLGHALSCTNKIWLLNRYLDYTLDSEKISKADVLSTIANIARNVVGQALAWNFVRTHWTYFNEEHEIDFSFVMEDVTRRFSTNIELQELKDFQTKHSDIIDSVLEKATERTQANIQWVQENKQSVLEWFQRESQSTE